jgi:DNA-binding beta-propeller fold protein YncE
MNSGQARGRLVQAGSVLAAVALIAGCGSNYRPVVTPINTSGPASQPTSYAVVVSAPSVTAPGIATVIDYSGDSVLAVAPIGPGPTTFTVDALGSFGYTINSDGSLGGFQVSPGLQAKNETFDTLPPTALPVNVYSPSAGLWVADLDGDLVDELTGSPQAFKLAIPVALTPVTIIGAGSISQRNYAISQNTTNPTGVECNISPTTGKIGSATPIETSSNTADAPIAVGVCPVFAVESADGRRLFVLNRGDDTVTVINIQDNTPNSCTPFVNQSGQTVTCHPVLPLSLSAVNSINAQCAITHSTLPPCGGPPNGTAGMGMVAGPVYAEYNSATNQLVVADYDGGTVSVIDASLDEYGNDSGTFGTTFTIPVGQTATPYPASVTVLVDGSRAYTANQGDGAQNGTVSIVNLTSHTLEKTLPVVGHPRTVVSTQNSQFGKVYSASPDSPYLTILRTDLDIVDRTILVEGNIVDVRVTSQNGSSGNANSVSRIPGYGEPCNLPPGSAALASPLTLASCSKLP